MLVGVTSGAVTPRVAPGCAPQVRIPRIRPTWLASLVPDARERAHLCHDDPRLRTARAARVGSMWTPLPVIGLRLYCPSQYKRAGACDGGEWRTRDGWASGCTPVTPLEIGRGHTAHGRGHTCFLSCAGPECTCSNLTTNAFKFASAQVNPFA